MELNWKINGAERKIVDDASVSCEARLLYVICADTWARTALNHSQP